MRRLGLAALGLSFSIGLATTGALAADPAAAERARLQGTWRAVAAERNGAPAPELVGHELTFAGDRFRVTSDGRPLYGGTYTIDSSAQPSRIDFDQHEGTELRGTWRGIYRLDGGRLEIASTTHRTWASRRRRSSPRDPARATCWCGSCLGEAHRSRRWRSSARR